MRKPGLKHLSRRLHCFLQAALSSISNLANQQAAAQQALASAVLQQVTAIKSAANSHIITITQVRGAGVCGGEEVEQWVLRVGQIGAAAGHCHQVRRQLPRHHHHPGRERTGPRM